MKNFFKPRKVTWWVFAALITWSLFIHAIMLGAYKDLYITTQLTSWVFVDPVHHNGEPEFRFPLIIDVPYIISGVLTVVFDFISLVTNVAILPVTHNLFGGYHGDRDVSDNVIPLFFLGIPVYYFFASLISFLWYKFRPKSKLSPQSEPSKIK